VLRILVSTIIAGTLNDDPGLDRSNAKAGSNCISTESRSGYHYHRRVC
jgi:hypothetical protein